tara:strand:- start:50 stop:355 length:306 start_codon:yes stop_codon:yes gene_type:complete
MNKIILLTISVALLTSCTSFQDAGKVLRNEKITTTDEFLIKKRDPLVLPPDFREIPKPKSQSNQIQKKNKIKDILKVPKEENISTNKSLSVEQSIIDKIKK